MPGLQFHKLDLHTHTPASKCYRYKDHTSEQIIQAALEKGLAGIAVTDHNTAAWIDVMRQAAKDTELVIFPGIEISMNEGFHLIALFDPEVEQRHVESLLGSIGIKPHDHGMQEALCTTGIYKVIECIHEYNGLAVLAHIDDHKGAFFTQVQQKENGKVSVPISCSKLFNEANYDAVECVHGKLPLGFDTNHQFVRFPAFYQASDNPDPEMPTRHSMSGLGRQYSWFKLDQINLEGLRQCFTDPEVRIRLMNEQDVPGYSKIISLKVGDHGFLRNQTFSFHQGLNSIIGGKGVGKSLAIEFLRFGLYQPPDDPALLSDHHKKLAARLESGTQIEIVYQMENGARFQIERRIVDVRRNGSLETAGKCIDLSSNEAYSGDISTMFPILAYSQTEVIKIAEDKNAQLQLIDKLIDTSSIEREISEFNMQLAENDQSLHRAIQARDRLESVEKEIGTLNARLEALNRALNSPLFESMRELEAKKAQFEEGYQYIDTLIASVSGWQSRVPKLIAGSSPEQIEATPELQQVYKVVAEARDSVTDAMGAIIESLGKQKSLVSELIMAWLPEFDALNQQYQQVLKELGGDRESKEQERKGLEREKRESERVAKELQSTIDDLETILVERKKLLDQLERTHRKYYDLRKKKYDELTMLSDGKLRVELEHAADKSKFEERLVDLLKGGNTAVSVGDRRHIAQNMAPRRFVQLVLDRNAPHLADEAEISLTWAERTIEKLWSTDDFTDVLALQHDCYPTDVPSIKFRKQGSVYGELSELSVGQKCTALLIIALCDGTMPVIIDQPEDALDVKSVWEDIAKKLRRGKNSRQFILTTHNSSVAVSADSDQFIILDAGASSGKIVASGAIDRPEVRNLVLNHLEGGPEPYGLRAQKYHIKL